MIEKPCDILYVKITETITQEPIRKTSGEAGKHFFLQQYMIIQENKNRNRRSPENLTKNGNIPTAPAQKEIIGEKCFLRAARNIANDKKERKRKRDSFSI
jgi:hypothetical protein